MTGIILQRSRLEENFIPHLFHEISFLLRIDMRILFPQNKQLTINVLFIFLLIFMRAHEEIRQKNQGSLNLQFLLYFHVLYILNWNHHTVLKFEFVGLLLKKYL